MYQLLLYSFILMPSVMLRTLPVAVLVALVYFGLLQNTGNPLWEGVLFLMLTTPSIAIVRMAALRAALVATGNTTPPTIDHLMRAQLRLAYGNLLPINIVQVAALLIITALISTDLSAALAEALTSYMTTGSSTRLDEAIAEFTFLMQLAGWVFSIIAAVGFGAMGTPMAATAANAAEKRPRHDITFGFAFNFWKMTVLYYVAQVFNAIVAILLSIVLFGVLAAAGLELAAYLLPVAATFYVAMHFSMTAAGAALSYGSLLELQADIRGIMEERLAGPAHSADDLRAMRRARQDNR